MKKLIGEPASVVNDMVAGLVRADDRLRRVDGQPVIVRADAQRLAARGQVALISGGGSGHEPAHAGYVGAGMLTAAVLGEVFTSPSVDTVLAAIEAVTGPAGCLLIVKNYTGDRLNFGLAAAIARSRGRMVDMVLVDDDAALAGGGRVGRRGLAGTVLIHKLAGAAAQEGRPLGEVGAIAQAAITRLRTMGVALSPCTVPIAGKPNFELGAREMELGLGIHGEPGMARLDLEPAPVIVERMLETILAQGTCDPAGDPLVLLVNGLGGTPAMELTIIAGMALAALAERGFRVVRAGVGNYLTALEMAGCSLSLLPVTPGDLMRLDAPTAAPAWQALTVAGETAPLPMDAAGTGSRDLRGPRLDQRGAAAVEMLTRSAIDTLIACEADLTELDRKVGDGDLGISLARGAQAVAAELEGLPSDCPAALLDHVSAIVRRSIGGTSGPVSAALFLGMATHLATIEGEIGLPDWTAAVEAGCASIRQIGGAERGDRTMLDALLPAVEALAEAHREGASAPRALRAAADAAMAGADATAEVAAALGRASYLGARAIGHPDPGARAVALVLRAMAKRLGEERP